MNTIAARWTNGTIQPAESVDWKEGTALRVTALPEDDEGMSPEMLAAEAEWKDDPASIEEWCEAVRNLEPVVLTDEERQERDLMMAEWKRFNIEAMRKAMFGEERS